LIIVTKGLKYSALYIFMLQFSLNLVEGMTLCLISLTPRPFLIQRNL